MTDTELVELLAAHRTLGSAPREQLAWLASRAQLHRFDVGSVLTPVGEPLRALFVILTGHAVIRVDRGSGPRKVLEWFGGDVSGLLPYSRLTSPPGQVTIEEPTEILMVGMGNPIQFSKANAQFDIQAQDLGEVNQDIYGGLLKMSAAEIAELSATGII